MPSKCGRFMNRSTMASIRSSFAKSAALSSPKSAAPPLSRSAHLPRFSSSRIPKELGCAASMMPLHNTVATTRMTSCLSVTSRDCRALSQDDIDDS